MNIGIMGTGSVARALASGCARAGHAVTLGSRHPESRTDLGFPVAGLDETARVRHQICFADCAAANREAIVADFATGGLAGGSWARVNVSRAWSVCMRAILSGFYSHPWAWNEIGFGGPAYPRGFMRTGPISTLEPYERPGATAEDAAAQVAAHPEEFG